MAGKQYKTGGWHWYEVFLLLATAAGVWLAVVEAGDAKGPQGAETWVWFGIATAVGLVIGSVAGRRSSLEPRNRTQLQHEASIVATFAAVLLVAILDAPDWLTLTGGWIAGGFLPTWVLTRRQRVRARRSLQSPSE
jgi:prolipoprotein diacylglyceryltransferase